MQLISNFLEIDHNKLLQIKVKFFKLTYLLSINLKNIKILLFDLS